MSFKKIIYKKLNIQKVLFYTIKTKPEIKNKEHLKTYFLHFLQKVSQNKKVY